MTWPLGGHLGSAVSALVDGQLDAASEERAWAHVMNCHSCRGLVEREGWVKRRLGEMSGSEPSARLLGSLFDLAPSDSVARTREAWAVVEEIESKGRVRRRAGLALVGAGSVSAAVLGIATLGAAPLGAGGTPSRPPASSLSRATTTPVQSADRSILAPTSRVETRFQHWSVPDGAADPDRP